MKEEIRWGIVGNHGLYVGQYFTRADAIIAHSATRARDVPEYEKLKRSWHVTDRHRQIWRKCRRNGDRAVKLRICWDE